MAFFFQRRVVRACTLCLCFSHAVQAQGLGDGRAPAPGSEELDAIERAWHDAEIARVSVWRRRPRLFVETGVTVARRREHETDALLLRRAAAVAPTLAFGVRYGPTAAFEVYTRAEVTGPLPLGFIERAAFQRVAASACEGERSFDLASAHAALITLDVGFRLRAFSALSPFYLGVALRVSAQPSGGSGSYAVRCTQLTGATTTLARGSASGETVVGDVGAHVETGYRFGAREQWDVGIRALVHALGTNVAGIGGAQLFLGWSYP